VAFGHACAESIDQSSYLQSTTVGSIAIEAFVLVKSHLSSRILYNRFWRFAFKPQSSAGGYVIHEPNFYFGL
jgi:hypothetical protein